MLTQEPSNGPLNIDFQLQAQDFVFKMHKAFVDNEYPITMDEPTTPGGSVYTVVDKTAGGQTMVQNVTDPTDVKIRPPQKGDTFAGPQIEEPPGGQAVKPEHLKCP